MRSSPTVNRHGVVDVAGARRWSMSATLTLALVASGCWRPPMSSGISPRLTPTAEVSSVSTVMAPVTTVPIRLVGAPSQGVLRWRHSYEGSGIRLPPMLMSIDGVPLGVRADSTVDHETAKALLQQIRCTDLVSIQVVKGEEALRRFGRAADSGVILVTTRSHGWRAQAGNP